MAIDFSLDAGVATITINRPERLNAMDTEHYEALSEAWIRVRDDDDIRCAVITGAGEKAFSVGADLKSRFGRKESWSDLWQTQKGQLLNRGLEIWKPVIAAVNGYCLGGGVTLMLATDIRIAGETATFNVAEVKRGLVPANGGTQRLMQQLPYAIAMEFMLTGESMTSAEAAKWGLVNKVVPNDQVLPTAQAMARKVANNAPLAVQAAKELALRSRDVDLATGLRMEMVIARLLRGTDDVKEGAAAFAEKRPPVFRGE